jgi:hypothetical protein
MFSTLGLYLSQYIFTHLVCVLNLVVNVILLNFVKLTTHLHLVQRSKNEWSYTSTPPIRLS